MPNGTFEGVILGLVHLSSKTTATSGSYFMDDFAVE
jgi:hypothetical protein